MLFDKDDLVGGCEFEARACESSGHCLTLFSLYILFFPFIFLPHRFFFFLLLFLTLKNELSLSPSVQQQKTEWRGPRPGKNSSPPPPRPPALAAVLSLLVIGRELCADECERAEGGAGERRVSACHPGSFINIIGCGAAQPLQ